ncbi:MAG TPA: S8 family serine peptidase [Solirubrobacteraceae bacterium]
MSRTTTAVVLALLAALPATARAHPQPAGGPPEGTYLVLYAHGGSVAAAHRAVARAGGRIVRENRAVGVAVVRGTKAFPARARGAAVAGVARNRTIGRVPREARRFRVEQQRDAGGVTGTTAVPRARTGEPFGALQWDMKLIGATPSGSYRYAQGSHKVRVGVIDTGIDGTHPDIKPNFDKRLSRNFTTDDPVIDGPCASDIDGSCQADPDNVDEDGHGTHVAGTIGAALNGLGMAGVAPKVDLVNLRAGQDSGYFFLMPTVDALTYAGDNGIDVANMSYYIDPWLFNCAHNAADSPAERHDQQVIRAAADRALNYAHDHGVTLIAAEGNEATDLGHPKTDDTSPDYPNQDTSPHHRVVSNKCVSEPSEGPHVINVSATGPDLRKAFYSDYGTERTGVAAPGGDSRSYFGTSRYRQPRGTEVLAPYPKNVGVAAGDINRKTGKVTGLHKGFVLRDCKGKICGYYQYLQGTSMAAPHAVGVAALIIARHGTPDRKHGGLKMAPDKVRKLLFATATKHACPAREPFTYPGEPSSENARCLGTRGFNGFYGHGIVNALTAARR